MLSGIKKAHVSAPELSILFRFIDPDNNYAFYRKESSKELVVPFLLPSLNAKASGEDLGIALAGIFQYAWRRQARELAKRESVQMTWGHFGGFWGILYCAFIWLRCLHLPGVRDRQSQYSDIEKAQQNPEISVLSACSHESQRALLGDLPSPLGRSTVSVLRTLATLC
jgi:hypothetical protein